MESNGFVQAHTNHSAYGIAARANTFVYNSAGAACDRYGNKNFVTGTGHTTTLGACPAVRCNPSFNAATNRFASGQGYTYDANGSLTVDATGQQYTLDAENRQTGLEDGSSNKLAEYAYDGEGKRVRKLISTSDIVTHFVYDAGGTLVEEWTTTPPMERNGLPSVSTTSYVYAGSRLISTETGSGTTYVTLDHLGSTRVTTDGSGNVTSRKDFMAFGEEAITVQRNVGVGYGVPPVRQDYTGYEKEAESGLEFAQARFQNPMHGRFTSVDPLTASATIRNPQSFNRYTYALNSPYKFTDPLGLLSQYSTGACGNRCKNSDPNNSGGGWVGLYYGLGQPLVETVWDPFAGGVQLAAGLTKGEVGAIVSAFEDVYGTEDGYNFFNQFNDVNTNATLVLTVGDLSKKDTDGNITWGLTHVEADSEGHRTVTITLDVARIRRYNDLKGSSSTSTSLNGLNLTEVKSLKATGKHEVAHGIDAMADTMAYSKRSDKANENRAVAIETDKSRWKEMKFGDKMKDSERLMKRISNYENYEFGKK